MLSSSILFFLLPFAAATTYTYIPCENCTDRATPTSLANISLYLYTGETTANYTSVLVGEAATLIDEIDSSKPTVLYISGWTECPDSDSVVGVVGAYLKRQDHNVMIVDWEGIAAQEYDYSANSVNGVGYTVAKGIDELVEAGLNSTIFDIVGHSLGAQVAAYIGRYVNFNVPRITGLDPAGPLFTLPSVNLNSDDADFVLVIHTDAGVCGNNFSIANVDFYPNGGSGPQPGCNSSELYEIYACSHARSWVFYVESLLVEDSFIGIECDSYGTFESDSCSSNDQVVMGYATPTSASGTFYLQTNSASPYGLGEEGVTYNEE